MVFNVLFFVYTCTHASVSSGISGYSQCLPLRDGPGWIEYINGKSWNIGTENGKVSAEMHINKCLYQTKHVYRNRCAMFCVYAFPAFLYIFFEWTASFIKL
jgi:hypothetical protein